MFIGVILDIFSTFSFLIFFTPVIIVFAIPSFWVLSQYLSGTRNLQIYLDKESNRLYSQQETFIHSCIEGSPIIRAFSQEDNYIQKYLNTVKHQMEIHSGGDYKYDWSFVLVFYICQFLLLSTLLSLNFSSNLTPELIGIVITVIMNSHFIIHRFINSLGRADTLFGKVERIFQFLDLNKEDNEKKELVNTNWPQEGMIEYSKINLKYSSRKELVLKNISFKIIPKEKVGIAGRTGSGKSSLFKLLLRIIDPSNGFINIDGVNVRRVPLETLRERITIIQQDPIIFYGTIRENLDPKCLCSDEEIWNALKDVQLDNLISSKKEKLSYIIESGGNNFSIGQKQLICLARAILKKSKILLLDESTSSIDLETDSLIQKIFKEKFSSCTILTIAHRLETILGCDRIMLLDQGEIIDFDTPKNLKEKNSKFQAMIES